MFLKTSVLFSPGRFDNSSKRTLMPVSLEKKRIINGNNFTVPWLLESVLIENGRSPICFKKISTELGAKTPKKTNDII